MKALVVDDAPDIRIYVRSLLQAWGYDADAASEGLEGFARIAESDVQLVICDWTMPGMSGPELCRAVREADLGHYVYVILLTGRSEKADLVEGLNSGADDFLSKPFDAQVLRARIRVAERLLGLEQRLAEQNRELTDSRNRLAQAYGAIQADLAAAARIQRQMLPTSDRVVAPWRAEWVYLPAAQVSGDGFNFFELTSDLIGFYHFDVSGHGIPAALLSASLSRSLIPGGGPSVGARARFRDPSRFVADLNRQLCDPESEVENFATVAYGTLDKTTGAVELTLAGHPRPIVLRRSGRIERALLGGLPLGLFPDAAFEPQHITLDPGDKLILYSDGVTDCENSNSEAFGDARLEEVAGSAASSPTAPVTGTLAERLREWRGSLDFEDDISVLVFERPLPAGTEDPTAQARNRGNAVTTLARLSLQSDPDAVAAVQASLLGVCCEAGLDELAAFQLTTAAIEAVNNCIRHGYSGKPGQPIAVDCHREGDSVAVVIRDRAGPLPRHLLEGGATPDAAAESGRGWHIIRAWTDAVTYTREAGENVLTLVRRSGHPSPADGSRDEETEPAGSKLDRDPG